MRYLQILGSAVALAGSALAQGEASSTVVFDEETKISYSSYTEPQTGMSFGIAIPRNATDPYDAILRVTAPITHKWTGMSWGGDMVFVPLSVAWPNANTATISARFAFGFNMPNAYDGAEHTYLKGTRTNTTHWTVNALCKGCTGWINSEETRSSLNASGTTQFGWAYSLVEVQDPSSNLSAFNVHKAVNKWTHDLKAAQNDNFESLVKANLLTALTAPSASTLVTSSVPGATSAPAAPAAIPSSCPNAGNAAYSNKIASGWKVTKVAGGLTAPRAVLFDSTGNMLLVESGKGISYHKMDANGCITSSKTMVAQNALNHGLALSVDGKTLYASSQTQAFSWPYDAAAGTVGTRTTIITGMVSGGSHLTRTLAITPHAPNLLVVSHGSNQNLDMATGDPKTGRAIVKVFDITKVPSAGYNYANDGYLAGYGQRNEVGLCFDKNNMLWGVENSGDDFTRNGRDIHNNNPGEKIHYMGDISTPNNNWYGYPNCFTVWQPSDFTGESFKVGDWFTQQPSASLNDSTCAQKATRPALTLMPHSAPIDCKFDATSTTMYITYHGSWDRTPSTGFKLVKVDFVQGADGAYKPKDAITSNSAATTIFESTDETKCAAFGASTCLRPAGLGWDAHGRLYMTSDASSGELWVVGKA